MINLECSYYIEKDTSAEKHAVISLTWVTNYSTLLQNFSVYNLMSEITMLPWQLCLLWQMVSRFENVTDYECNFPAMILMANQMEYLLNKRIISLAFCPKPNNFACL